MSSRDQDNDLNTGGPEEDGDGVMETGSSEDEEEEEDDDSDEDDDEDEEDEEGEDEETEGEGEEEDVDQDGDEGEESEEDDEDEEDEDDDDEGEGDEDDEEEEEMEEEGEGEDASQLEESSGDENCDRCPICLSGIRQQDVGTPESCDHVFCLECIQEWAKNLNTCPVDRQVFRIILARHAGQEKVYKRLPVEDRQQREEEEEEDPTYCEVCGQSDREDRLLLCDGCDLGYHCECLDPPLARVPINEWFCPDCQLRRENAQTEEHHRLSRQIARTRISEHVRRVIADARAERAASRRRIAEMIAAQEAFQDEDPVPGPSASTSAAATPRRKSSTTRKRTTTTRKKTTTKRKRKRKSTAKRKRKTKRKTTKRKTTRKTKRKGKKKKGKGRKKGTKKKSSSASPARALARTASVTTSVKGRIADRLGLSRPPAGRSIPMQKVPAGSTRQEGGRVSVDHGATFSILGSKDELYSFADQEGEERQPVSRPAIPAETFLSRNAKSSHKPLSFSPAKRKIVVKEPPVATASASLAATGGGFDLLGSIMQNQDMLHKGSKHVTINRDGSLTSANSGTTSPQAAITSSSTSHQSGNTNASQRTITACSSHKTPTTTSIASSSACSYSDDTPSCKKLPPTKSVSFSMSHKHDLDSVRHGPSSVVDTERSYPGSSVSTSSRGGSSSHPGFVATAVDDKFSDTASSDEELAGMDAALEEESDLSVKQEISHSTDATCTSTHQNEQNTQKSSTDRAQSSSGSRGSPARSKSSSRESPPDGCTFGFSNIKTELGTNSESCEHVQVKEEVFSVDNGYYGHGDIKTESDADSLTPGSNGGLWKVENAEGGIKQEILSDDCMNQRHDSTTGISANHVGSYEGMEENSSVSYNDQPVGHGHSLTPEGSYLLDNGSETDLREVKSVGSDSAVVENGLGSHINHDAELNTGGALEIGSAFSDNARLSVGEDSGSASHGFHNPTESQSSQRNFAAVASDMNSVTEDSSLAVMKRNFDLLVSSRGGLAGFESGDEGSLGPAGVSGNHAVNEREEGEASDSGEEGEIRDEEEWEGEGEEQEEGEIVENEEEQWGTGGVVCVEESSGGLDVNALHVEEMEIGTSRKRSLSQTEESGHEGNKRVKSEEELEGTADMENKKELEDESEEEEDDSDDTCPMPQGSFMLANFLTSLKTNEFDKKKERDKQREEKRLRKEEEKRRKDEEEAVKREQGKPLITILDFIDSASAKKFGLPATVGDGGGGSGGGEGCRERHDGGDSFRRRTNQSDVDRQHDGRRGSRRSTDRTGQDFPSRRSVPGLERRRRSGHMEDMSRRRSRSRDSRETLSHRSGSRESRSSRSHHPDEIRNGRRKREEKSRDRRRRSRSRSPRRRGEKRRRGWDEEEDDRTNRHWRKDRRSRTHRKEEEREESSSGEEEEGDAEGSEEESDDDVVIGGQPNGLPHPASPNSHPAVHGHHPPSHPYPAPASAYQPSGVPAPPETPPLPPPPPLPPALSHAPLPTTPHPHVRAYPHPPHPSQAPYPHTHPSPHGQPAYPPATHGHTTQPGNIAHPYPYPASHYPPHPQYPGARTPNPTTVPHPYPYPSYAAGAVRATATTTTHPTPQIPHAAYAARTYPRAVAGAYPQPTHHPAYQPRPAVTHPASTAGQPVGYTATTAPSTYPPRQPVVSHSHSHLTATSNPPPPHYPYPTTHIKPEPGATGHQPAAVAVRRDSGGATYAHATAMVKPEHDVAPVPQRSRGLRESLSPTRETKPSRASYRISPPSAPIKGVTTFDRVDSSILLNEVKKGFRQLVEDAVRVALKPAWSSRKISKDEYKDIFKRAVEKVCGSKETVVHQEKIQSLVDAYVIKARKARTS